jgi:hypothetical protein
MDARKTGSNPGIELFSCWVAKFIDFSASDSLRALPVMRPFGIDSPRYETLDVFDGFPFGDEKGMR